MQTIEALEQFRFHGKVIPERMRGGIARYIDSHVEPGGFLRAVICNDLKEACGRADDENIGLLHVYVAFFYNHAPISCWGSVSNFERWIHETNA